MYSVSAPVWADGEEEPTVNSALYGSDSTMGTDAKVNTFSRRLHFDGGFAYENTFGMHGLYSQLKYEYEYEDPEGINNTIYRRNYSWWTHYGYDNRLYADLALVVSGSSRLAPGSKWAFSPTLSGAWVISREKFMQKAAWVDFLKLRASVGIINADYLPGDNVWTYYAQQYSTSGGTYPFDSGWNSEFGRTYLGQMATADPSHEKAYKYNIGVDAKLFGALDLSLDLWRQRRSDIWVSSAGKYSSVLGMDAPYENAGKVDSHGTHEILAGVEYDINDKFTVSCGGQRTDYGLTDEYQQNTSFACDSYSIGLGGAWNINDKIRLNVSYFTSIYSDYDKTYTSPLNGGTGYNGTPFSAKETYSRTNHVIGVGIDYKF